MTRVQLNTLPTSLQASEKALLSTSSIAIAISIDTVSSIRWTDVSVRCRGSSSHREDCWPRSPRDSARSKKAIYTRYSCTITSSILHIYIYKQYCWLYMYIYICSCVVSTAFVFSFSFVPFVPLPTTHSLERMPHRLEKSDHGVRDNCSVREIVQGQIYPAHVSTGPKWFLP